MLEKRVRASAGAARARTARGAFHLLDCVAEPAGPALAIPADGALLRGDTGAGLRALLDPRLPADVALEPLARHGLDLLLVLGSAAAELWINGAPAPRAAVLRPGDELMLGSGAPLLVDFFRAPPFAHADEEQARSARCQLCRGPFRPGERVWVCPCGALAHAEAGAGEPEPAGVERLDCAFGTCTSCGREVVTEAGYVHTGNGSGGRHASHG